MERLTAATFFALLSGGAKTLLAHKQQVNDLNVFPIADGDTGNNMTDCLLGGLVEPNENESLGAYSRRAADGMLYKARGNSGVILSQFFDGLAQGLASIEEADVYAFHQAHHLGVKRAYEVVMKPVEGTMLTVMREGFEALEKEAETLHSFDVYFARLVEAMSSSLLKTPDLLPVLKASGVVDSGGAGFLLIVQGMLAAIGQSDNIQTLDEIFTQPILHEDKEEVGFCTEFILKLTDKSSFDLEAYKGSLQEKGGSIVAFCNGDLVKVHIHTLIPNQVLDEATKYGEIVRFKMDDMGLQKDLRMHRDVSIEEKEISALAFVPNAAVGHVFSDYGVDQVLITENFNVPSLGDMLVEIKKAPGKHVFVFPNDANAFLAADMLPGLLENKEITIVHTRDLGQGICAVSTMDKACFSVEDNLSRIDSALRKNHSFMVGVAVKEATLNKKKVHVGDYLAYQGSRCLSVHEDIVETFIQALISDTNLDDKEVLIYLYHEQIDEATLARIEEKALAVNPFLEVYPLCGGDMPSLLIACLD